MSKSKFTQKPGKSGKSQTYGQRGNAYKGKQGGKDSKSKRDNFDNVRDSKLPEVEDKIKQQLERRDSNDVRWYTKNKGMMEAACRLNFATISGLTLPPLDDQLSSLQVPPTVMELIYAPDFNSDPAVVAQAFNGMYSYVVHANSRNQSYDAPDLAIIYYAGCEIFAAISLGIRVYGLMREFTERNVTLPHALVEASGFDYADCKLNYSHMWADLQRLIAESRQIWLPTTMPIIERRLWMNTHIYKDSESANAQYFVYTPGSFYKYSGYTDRKGGKLVKVPQWKLLTDGSLTANGSVTPKSVSTWSNYLAMVQSMIDAIIPDQDRGIMYGDILKAYGVGGIFALGDLAIDYKTIPTYNREVLWQIENATGVASWPVEIKQTTDGLLQQIYGGIGHNDATLADGTSAPKNIILNFHQDENPIPEQIMVATRMSAAGNKSNDRYVLDNVGAYIIDTNANFKKVNRPETGGTETLIAMNIHYRTYLPGGKTWSNMSQILFSHANQSKANLVKWSAFDWAPLLYDGGRVVVAGSDSYEETNDIYAEYDNWANVSNQTLRLIHDAAVYSLLDMPTLR